MKICVVSLNIVPYFQSDKRSRFGGAEVQAAFVSEALTYGGHDVSMVVSDLDPDCAMPYPTYNAFDGEDGVRGLRFLHPRMMGVFRALQAADADVYYQRNAGMVTGVTAMFCRRHHRIFVYGGGSPVDYSIRTAHIDGLRDKLIYMYGLKRADGIVVQNDEQLQLAKQAVKAPIRVIPNGVDTKDGPTSGERDVIVWVGAVRRLKRPDWFVQLARRMPNQKFVMIGGSMSTEPSFGQRMMDEARALPNMEVTGWLGREDTMSYVRRARLLVNTSEFEGFPNVYLEAWKFGVPVLSVNDVDGLIADKGLGAIVASQDEMHERLRELVAEPDALVEMGRRGRALVEDRFSPAALARQYDDFFQELTQRHRTAPH